MAERRSAAFQPLAGSGVDIDLETLRPMNAVQAETEAYRDHMQNAQAAALTALIIELGGQPGEIMRRLVERALNRIRVLVSTDAELSLIMHLILDVVGPGARAADIAARSMVRDLICRMLDVAPAPPSEKKD